MTATRPPRIRRRPQRGLASTARALALASLVLSPLGCSSCDRPEPPPSHDYQDPASAASQLLERAERVAASAEKRDPSLSSCALAWLELGEMARGEQGDAPSFPSRAAFEAKCEQLPAAAQRCLRVSVSLRDPEGCRQINHALSPEQMVILRGLMTGDPPPEASTDTR